MPRGHVALLPGHMCGWGRRPEEGPAKGLPSIVSPFLHAMCDHFPSRGVGVRRWTDMQTTRVDAVSVMPNVVVPMVTSRIMVAVMHLALPAPMPLMSMSMRMPMPMPMIMSMPMSMPMIMPMIMIMPMPAIFK
ncbi:hypothetical protein SISNIDRAFT_457932 [Sistotremastrum niveocremeum HHB9708]|uniref:Uncharacterized protein n=1 Tax=Sistotremastrum niveocremeum HHB9708 TaxID=1314777 RepID=A0A164QXE3_9AGAM|nr:hypothetical protein SISNIDRAFT_457932 [Sistotremastrum niveocremeum HHB9708]